MKNAKKLAGVLLALIMVFALSATTFAAGAAMAAPGNSGTITLDGATEGSTYKIYQVLKLNTSGKDSYYTIASGWDGFIRSNAINRTYVNVNWRGHVTFIEGADMNEFVKLALEYADEHNIRATGSQTATSSTVEFTGLPWGYYVVGTTVGSASALGPDNSDQTLEDKREYPTNEKEVQEDSKQSDDDEGWGSANDADIGQVVNFQSTITTQANTRDYVFHDKMSSGLTFDSESISVTLNGETIDDYTIIYPANDGDTFDIEFTFSEDFYDTLDANSKIVIYYSATVNENAVVGNDGNENTSKIYFYDDTDETTYQTPDSTTTTYTWGFDVLKYANGDETKVLEGAKFILLNSDKSQAATIANGKLTGWTDVENGTVLTTDEDGKITIEGLDADTYYLKETEAPEGYNLLADDVEVTIEPTENNDGTLTLDALTVKVENQSGPEIPSTGGIGTTIFYAAGTVLVLGAAVLLIVKKRMSVEK